MKENLYKAYNSEQKVIKEVGIGIRSGGRKIIVIECRNLVLLLSKLFDR